MHKKILRVLIASLLLGALTNIVIYSNVKVSGPIYSSSVLVGDETTQIPDPCHSGERLSWTASAGLPIKQKITSTHNQVACEAFEVQPKLTDHVTDWQFFVNWLLISLVWVGIITVISKALEYAHNRH